MNHAKGNQSSVYFDLLIFFKRPALASLAKHFDSESQCFVSEQESGQEGGIEQKEGKVAQNTPFFECLLDVQMYIFG